MRVALWLLARAWPLALGFGPLAAAEFKDCEVCPQMVVIPPFAAFVDETDRDTAGCTV